MKLARLLSTVQAACLLHKEGFYQEQSILHRVIDETNEDILFLALAISNNEFTESHKSYLEGFWEEEIDDSGALIHSRQKRKMIPRQKIRAYITKQNNSIDPSTQQEVSRTITKLYSGYVHGAAPHILDMYVGNPPYYHTKGMANNKERKNLHIGDLWNYAYRSFLSFIVVAKVFGDSESTKALSINKLKFEKNAGMI